jgi:DNA-binding SARP family transcriptional activator
MQMGRLTEAVASLQRAAAFWTDPPTSPFADNADLVLALLAVGLPEKARLVASEAIRRTEPWPRPLGHARYGVAAVHVFDGRFSAAITELAEIRSARAVTGGMYSIVAARLIEAMFLAGATPSELTAAARDLDAPPQDKRYFPETVAARAIATHVDGRCRGKCFGYMAELEDARRRGESHTVLLASVKICAVAVEHNQRRITTTAWAIAEEARDRGLAPLVKYWLRRYAASKSLRTIIGSPAGARLVAHLIDVDPDGWRDRAIDLLDSSSVRDRSMLVATIVRNANRETANRLKTAPGHDIAAARRRLQHLQAVRLYVKTFGKLEVHRSNWNGPEIRIDKKRVRALLAVLAAHSRQTLSRDAATDLLWPEADGDSAVNNLNQTVFQLRRYLDPDYRGGDSPDYVISNSDEVALDTDLVHSDLAEVGRLPSRLSGADWHQRHVAANRAIDLVQGEFLSDLRYEDWVSRLQLSVHAEVRRLLLPVAQAGPEAYDTETAARAAGALLKLDPFDEAATLALASAMALSGRRIAARNVVVDYVKRLRSEFADEPSSQFVSAAGALGAHSEINDTLTLPPEEPSRA